MKAILCSLLLLVPVSSLLAQGTISWGNAIGATTTTTSVRAPVFGPDPSDPFNPKLGNSATGFPAGTQTYGGEKLDGTNFTLALFTMVGTNFVELDRTTFRTGVNAGLATGPRFVNDPHHPPGSSVTAVFRAWDNQGGTITSWDQALAATSVPLGESAPITVTGLGGFNASGGPDLLPAQTTGVRSFNLHLSGGVFIAAQPQDLIVPAGASAQFQIGVTSQSGTPSFQWQRDGTDIPGATSVTLTLTNVQYTDAGGYSAIVTDSPLTLTSRVARLSVQPAIAGISHFFIEDWGADAIRLAYDSTPNRPVRIEVRSALQDTWINMGQFVNSSVRGFFFDIGPTNDMRLYRLSTDP